MGCLFEIFGELFIEIFGHLFIYLGSAFLPKKGLSEKAKKVLKGVSAVVSVLIMFDLVIGIIILIEDGVKSILGWALISSAVFFVILALVFVGIKHPHDEENNKEE